ncbi:hypothetical protein EIN_469370 [Entamoeba invadens IP1]|uniref:Rho-GAP domain-containing protein n=1 Tax=Entamoeba invadens IP1 TaxID=370355 RepID=A0A0A1TWK6_ENTIV|nr:hypothetical protein EIN_469370 [Entamoeba invadens IP1]ELP83733.1 hypothetical protein EIN_469370 [Entamoeba invadens IP1]|eukprot:XP_004183079.1 hypothetical protein EIN_469370 [Entamoeba invadens IP1]
MSSRFEALLDRTLGSVPAEKELADIEFVTSNLKSIEELDIYSKKQRTITNKILDTISELLNEFGELSDLQSTHQTSNKEEAITQSHSINFILFVQGSLQVMREELVKGFAKQMEYIIGSINEAKSTFQKNQKKPVDSLECLTIAKAQLDKIIEKRNQIILSHQLIAFSSLANAIQNNFQHNHELSDKIAEIDNLEDEADSTVLKAVSYSQHTLGEILDAEKRKRTELPKAIEQLIEVISTKHYLSEGIFRTNAASTSVNDICLKMAVTDFSVLPADLLAGVLKKFVRNLPSMLFSNLLAKDILIAFQASPTPEQKISNLKTLFDTPKWVPPEKLVLFKAICIMCHIIASHSDVNLMNEKNLSVCWTPTMFSVSTEELSQYLALMEFIIKESDEIFKRKNVKKIGTRKTQIPESQRLKLVAPEPELTNSLLSSSPQQTAFINTSPNVNTSAPKFAMGYHQRDSKDSKEAHDLKEPRLSKDSQEAKEVKDTLESKDCKDLQDLKEQEEMKDPMDLQEEHQKEKEKPAIEQFRPLNIGMNRNRQKNSQDL